MEKRKDYSIIPLMNSYFSQSMEKLFNLAQQETRGLDTIKSSWGIPNPLKKRALFSQKFKKQQVATNNQRPAIQAWELRAYGKRC